MKVLLIISSVLAACQADISEIIERGGPYQYNAPATNTYLAPAPVFAGTNFDPARAYLPVVSPEAPKPTVPAKATGGGQYRWNLDLSGSHEVENPHYQLNTKLH